jgi:broad specificity phosphatase PhoE
VAVFVHLVRHGDVHNPEALSYGRLPGFHLSELGRQQALDTASYLRAFGGEVTSIASSPLERAQQTADILRAEIGDVPARTDERLIEASSWRDGLPRALAPLAYARRYFNPAERRKSELPAEVARRMAQAVHDALQTLERDGAAAVLVSHQSPIALTRVAFDRGLDVFDQARLARITPWVYARGPCDLASVTTLVFSERGAKPHMRYFAPTL